MVVEILKYEFSNFWWEVASLGVDYVKLGKVLKGAIVLGVLPNRYPPLPLKPISLLITPSSILIQINKILLVRIFQNDRRIHNPLRTPYYPFIPSSAETLPALARVSLGIIIMSFAYKFISNLHYLNEIASRRSP